jgi:hypothetical protein
MGMSSGALKWSPRDNSTGREKIRLRQRLLASYQRAPRVLETHGGWGRIFERVWWKAAPDGVVIERDEKKCAHLSRQRPTWRVYEGDSAAALARGLAAELRFDVVDLDPWGSTLPHLEALFHHRRLFGPRLDLIANDGARLKTKLGGAWSVKAFAPYVAKFGNDLFPVYLDVLKLAVEDHAKAAGFRIARWEGYYCGHADDLAHYWAHLEKE